MGLVGVLGVGYITFRLQSRLPYKQMLVVTGVLIGAVLLVMVGNTTHVLQIVGWAPLHPIRTLTLPYWFGLWFGVYATWGGLLLQAAAAIFVIGSYVLSERMQTRQMEKRREQVCANAGGFTDPKVPFRKLDKPMTKARLPNYTPEQQAWLREALQAMVVETVPLTLAKLKLAEIDRPAEVETSAPREESTR